MGRSESSTSVKSESNSKLGIEVLAERSIDNSSKSSEHGQSSKSKKINLMGFESDDDDDDDILVKKTGKQHHESICENDEVNLFYISIAVSRVLYTIPLDSGITLCHV